MKKLSAKSTCEVSAVIVGMGVAYDASTPEKEQMVWTKLFKNCDKRGNYQRNGKWTPFSEAKASKAVQEQYLKAKSGDLPSMKSLMMRHGVWHFMQVRDPNAPIDL